MSARAWKPAPQGIKIPSLQCRGLCQASCTLVPCSTTEAAALGPKPSTHYDDDPLTCAWLDGQGRCSTYDTRPAVCRFFGVVKRMRCPHGCRPKRWLRPRAQMAILAATGHDVGTVILVAEGTVPIGRAAEILKETTT